MNYWLVRAKWGGEDKTREFLDNNIWENGYRDGTHFKQVKSIQKGDILLLADGSHIRYYGICSENLKDGIYVHVEKWVEIEEAIYLRAQGRYIWTISKINNDKTRKNIADTIRRLNKGPNVSNIEIQNFTVFSREKLEFSPGLNVIVGENGSGKSHLLRLIYSLIKSNNAISRESLNKYDQQRKAAEILINIFKTEKLGNLVRKGSDEASIPWRE